MYLQNVNVNLELLVRVKKKLEVRTPEQFNTMNDFKLGVHLPTCISSSISDGESYWQSLRTFIGNVPD